MSRLQIGTLIIIDDDQVDQMLYKRMICRSGIVDKVKSFYYAQDALDYLSDPSNAPVDLVLLDINMPRMSGIEFLGEATKRFGPRFAKMVVVMLTSSLNPEDKEAAMAYEAVKAIYHKPLSLEHLEELAGIIHDSA
jgi:CheY-like chemotaxis protein